MWKKPRKKIIMNPSSKFIQSRATAHAAHAPLIAAAAGILLALSPSASEAQ
jgi:hypothetical protein